MRPRDLRILALLPGLVSAPQGGGAGLPPMPRGLCLETPAHYSFGCAVAPDGSVWFTEFNHRQVRRYDPRTGRCETVARGLPGAYGIVITPDRRVYVGQDLGDSGNPGRVIRLDPASGAQVPVIEGLTRPRQLACDPGGKLYVVCEAGSARTGPQPSLMCLDPETGRVEVEACPLRAPQGVAVAPDGTLFVSEYGAPGERPGRGLSRAPGGQWRTLAEGFWRARGLALGAGGQLYLTTESDFEDHGNAGDLVRINAATGAAGFALRGLDYPQFPAAAADGRAYFVLNRDSWLASYDPSARPTVYPWPGDPLVTVSCSGGLFGPHVRGTPLEIRAGDVVLRGAIRRGRRPGPVCLWVRIPAERLGLSREELYTNRGDPEHPQPGLFALPEVAAWAQAGQVTASVLAQRGHVGRRFPMLAPGTAGEAAAPGFSESPVAYLVFVRRLSR